jgi:signal transduction histidine kinase
MSSAQRGVRATRALAAEQATAALLRLTARANCARRTEELYEPALDAVTELLHVERASILLFDDAGVMRFKAWRGLSSRYRSAVEGHSPWTRDTVDPVPLCIEDAREDPSLADYGSLFESEGIRALAFIPLICRGQLLGKFMAYAPERRVFTPHELTLAQVVASQVAEACGRARLIEAEQSARTLAERSADRTRRLLRMTSQLSKALLKSEIAELVIEEGALALEASSCGMWLVNDSELRLLGQRGYPAEVAAHVRTIQVADDVPVARAVQLGEPVWLQCHAEYVAAFPRFARWSDVAMERVSEVAVAALPLIIRGRVLGVLALAFNAARVFDEAERSFLVLLAQHCAQAIERARLYREGQAAQARADLLARASAVLASSLECETTLRNLVHVTVPELCDWCSVEMLDDAGKVYQLAVHHVDEHKRPIALAMRSKYPPDPQQMRGVMKVIRTGEPELHEVVTEAMLRMSALDDQHLRLGLEIGIHSVMIVPMHAHGRSFGAITFVSSSPARRFTRVELETARQIGERAAVSLHNALLYDQAIGAVRVRDEFLSIAGHELRTPLTALLLQAQAIVNGAQAADPARVRQRGERILRSSLRLTKLVDELLDVTRITSGRLELSREPIDLASLLDDVLHGASEQIERSGARVRFVEREPAIGSWDRHRLEQVVMNLLSNALKYGANEPIEVAIARCGAFARLCVRDRGIGISAEHQARIFGRFERAVSSRNFGGLGLGLWISREIVEAHGGSITVTSEPGQGAEFVVLLPLEAPTSSAARNELT